MNKPEALSATQSPKLSVVIGSHNARSSVRECLSALEKQRQGLPDQEVEIIIVDNSTDGTTELIRIAMEEQGRGRGDGPAPNLKLVEAPATALIPELWGIGVRQSSGAIIATTTSHFTPRPDWFEQILRAHESSHAGHAGHAGIGGAIENDDSSGLVDWAVYFCRYSSFMPPFVEKAAREIAADNASYKRSALAQWRQSGEAGFWETVVHAGFRKQGLSLLLSPAIVVTHKRSFALFDFIRQRFQHGRQYGGARAERISTGRKWVYALLSPLIPLLFLARISRLVVTRRAHIGKFLLSLPILSLFLSGWAMGELWGYLLGEGGDPDVKETRIGNQGRE
jgi:hypothetical protein